MLSLSLAFAALPPPVEDLRQWYFPFAGHHDNAPAAAPGFEKALHTCCLSCAEQAELQVLFLLRGEGRTLCGGISTRPPRTAPHVKPILSALMHRVGIQLDRRSFVSSGLCAASVSVYNELCH